MHQNVSNTAKLDPMTLRFTSIYDAEDRHFFQPNLVCMSHAATRISYMGGIATKNRNKSET
jgi:hypothetical protein